MGSLPWGAYDEEQLADARCALLFGEQWESSRCDRGMRRPEKVVQVLDHCLRDEQPGPISPE